MKDKINNILRVLALRCVYKRCKNDKGEYVITDEGDYEGHIRKYALLLLFLFLLIKVDRDILHLEIIDLADEVKYQYVSVENYKFKQTKDE